MQLVATSHVQTNSMITSLILFAGKYTVHIIAYRAFAFVIYFIYSYCATVLYKFSV